MSQGSKCVFFPISIAFLVCLLGTSWTFAANSKPRVPKQKRLRADRVVIAKKARTMWVLNGDQVLGTYRVALGGNPIGPKQRQGDRRTPEGVYRIDARNPQSRFYLSLRISYPNATDRARAASAGVSPGGDIMIHGLGKRNARVGSLHRLHDWTDGCVAVTNEEIREIWNLVPLGATVEIRP